MVGGRSSSGRRAPRRRVAKALRAIHEQPKHPWTLGSLAECAGMSRSAFAEHFSRIVGDPPLRYLTGWRLSLADRLLRSGGVGVAEVGHRVGSRSEPGSAAPSRPITATRRTP